LQLLFGGAIAPLVVRQVYAVDDYIGVGDRRLHHVDIVSVALDERRPRHRLAIASRQRRHRPARVLKSAYCRIADIAVAAQYRHVTLGHVMLLLLLEPDMPAT